jgi:dolichol-phosphate mannosyltransferase
MTAWIVLPAFNEAEGLPALLEACTALAARTARVARRGGAGEAGQAGTGPFHVVVVDDGSIDGTGEVARSFSRRLPVTVLVHATNQGLAAAIRTGLAHACGAAGPDDVIVTMDADNTHRPEQIQDMVREIAAGADIVIASRYVRGARQAGVPRHRAFLSAAVGWMLRIRFGLPGVRDYSCGYRAYRAGLLQEALRAYGDHLIESAGFVVMTEVLVKLAPFRPHVREIPLDLRYDWKVGPSKMPARQTIAGYLGLIIKVARRPRLRPRPDVGVRDSRQTMIR